MEFEIAQAVASSEHEASASQENDITDLLVVAHPGDEISRFFSILFPSGGLRPQLVVCTKIRSGHRHFLDQRSSTTSWPQVVFGSESNHLDKRLDEDVMERLLSNIRPPKLQRIWTHNPADNHHHHSEVALAVSLTFPNVPTFYAHDVASGYQCVADVCNPLTPAQIDQKIEMLNSHYPDQLLFHPRWGAPGCDTRSICSVENFVRLSPEEVRCLYALRHSLEPEAATDEDPWRFKESPYESDRLQAIVLWLERWIDPKIHTIVEVGACEGALTQRLISAGFRNFVACEPNLVFRNRLERNLSNTDVTIKGVDLETLAAMRDLQADFYLLLDMLYYVGDLNVLNSLPTSALMISVDDEFRFGSLELWLRGRAPWRVVHEQPLVAPRIEFCVSKKVYQRKQGSRGLVLYKGNLKR